MMFICWIVVYFPHNIVCPDKTYLETNSNVKCHIHVNINIIISYVRTIGDIYVYIYI